MNDLTSFNRRTSEVGIDASVTDDATPVPSVEPPLFGSPLCRIPNCKCPCHDEVPAECKRRRHRSRLTDDESTWTNPVPASKADERWLMYTYVPRLFNAYVYEKLGGRTEVKLRIRRRDLRQRLWGSLRFRADNKTRSG